MSLFSNEGANVNIFFENKAFWQVKMSKKRNWRVVRGWYPIYGRAYSDDMFIFICVKITVSATKVALLTYKCNALMNYSADFDVVKWIIVQVLRLITRLLPHLRFFSRIFLTSHRSHESHRGASLRPRLSVSHTECSHPGWHTRV